MPAFPTTSTSVKKTSLTLAYNFVKSSCISRLAIDGFRFHNCAFSMKTEEEQKQV